MGNGLGRQYPNIKDQRKLVFYGTRARDRTSKPALGIRQLIQLTYTGMVPSRGFEPLTLALEPPHSIQLSYEGKETGPNQKPAKTGCYGSRCCGLRSPEVAIHELVIL